MDLASKFSEWIGANSKSLGGPVIVRARIARADQVPVQSLPNLFVLTYEYEPTDHSGLPSRSQYDEIAKVERDVFDAMESMGKGCLVLVQTHRGKVRYYSYVADVDAVASLVNSILGQHVKCELSAIYDPEWSEYRKRLPDNP